MQIARIKQTVEKVLDKNTPLPERILTLIREQIVFIISTLNAIVRVSQQLYFLP